MGNPLRLSVFLPALTLLVVLSASATSSLRAEDSSPWPRSIEIPKATIVIYQPQLETFKGDRLTARAAMSVNAKSDQAPIFGVVWFAARVSTDREERIVTLIELDVTDVRFPDASEKSVGAIKALIEKEFPKWEQEVSLDRVLTSLELAEQEQVASRNLQADPPKIIFKNHPAVLVLIDGEAKLQKVQDSSVMRVVNSPAFIVLDPGTKAYYLFGEDEWLKATDLQGSWTLETSPPAAVVGAAKAEDLAVEGGTAAVASKERPEIIVVTEPTELIVTDGDPQYASLTGTSLLYMSDTESDVFLDIGSQTYYVLLSGRWYRGNSLEGPWAHVDAEDLPQDFAKIPPGSKRGHILASVPGTAEAKEAVLDAQIPQTAQVQRSDATVEVTYDGEPQFEAIEETEMAYAVNTSYSVIRVGHKFYCCHDGVWFESSSPTGPWVVCVSVPGEIYTIPPSCPHYHVKYVYVYDYTPTVVYVGYTPGYTGCYVYGGCVWYGTGYRYRYWYGRRYYPRPVTYGYAVRYNPYTGGWRVAVGARGPYYGVRVGVARGPAGGTWVGVGVGGRVGYRGGRYRRGDVDIDINRNINVNRNNIYNRRNDVVRTQNRRPSQRPGTTRPATREAARDRVATADRPGTRQARPPGTSSTPRQNNVFADRNGNVFRNVGNGWEQRTKSGWTRSTTPATSPVDGARTSRPGTTRPSTTRPGTTRPSTTRPSTTRPTQPQTRTTRTPSSLDRAAQARSRGTQRTTRYNNYRSSTSRPRTTSRPTTRSAPRRSAPARRGGGGMRRR